MNNGFILWEGPSPATGEPIAAIVTMTSRNPKTGDMAQVWIMQTDIPPNEAVKAGEDQAVCGGCRFAGGRGCYVQTHQAPRQVWKAYKAGKYPRLDPEDYRVVFKWKAVRLGAYGDPAMVPFEILERVTRFSRGWTGYTHQSGQSWFDPRYLQLCMVSTDTDLDYFVRQMDGVRQFVTLAEFEKPPAGAVECPNTTTGVQCRDCQLCNGGHVGKSVYIRLHGARMKKAIQAKGYAV